MNTTDLLVLISKGALVLYILVNLPLAGIALIALLIHTEDRIKVLKRQLDAALSEDEEQKILTQGLENLQIVGTPDNITEYEECVIENYHDKFFRIMKPDGEFLPKIFLSKADAMNQINLVKDLLTKTKRERSKIYNIRYVK